FVARDLLDLPSGRTAVCQLAVQAQAPHANHVARLIVIFRECGHATPKNRSSRFVEHVDPDQVTRLVPMEVAADQSFPIRRRFAKRARSTVTELADAIGRS